MSSVLPELTSGAPKQRLDSLVPGRLQKASRPKTGQLKKGHEGTSAMPLRALAPLGHRSPSTPTSGDSGSRSTDPLTSASSRSAIAIVQILLLNAGGTPRKEVRPRTARSLES